MSTKALARLISGYLHGGANVDGFTGTYVIYNYISVHGYTLHHQLNNILISESGGNSINISPVSC